MDRKAEETKQYMTKADVVVIIVCLLAAFILAVCLWGSRKQGKMLYISYDGETIVTMKLGEAADGSKQSAKSGEPGIYYLITYEESRAIPVRYEERPDIPAGVNYNLVYISPEKVRMEAADCRDQICVYHRPIGSGGDSIICLPHRLVVEITGGEQQDAILDGMVK